MKLQIPPIIRQSITQFADLYHEYKVYSERLHKSKYAIHSSLSYYKKTGMLQLSYNDKPGDLLPPMSIQYIKNTTDLLSGLHPVDVNSINDLFYLSQDKISELVITDNKIRVTSKSGQVKEYDVHEKFEDNNIITKRVSFLIGYMQAEKHMQNAYKVKEKYKLVRDNITTLGVLDLETNEEVIKNPLDILFSNDYLNFSKEDISRIGYICGQMIKV